MKPLKNKYRLPSDAIGDDLPWWHEIIRAAIFAATLIAMTYLLFGIQ